MYQMLGMAFSLSTLLIWATPVGVSAQENGEEYYCGYDDEGGAQKQGAMLAASVPSAGVYRALIVFVRFADDTAGSREWPVGLTAPPAFADGLISSSPVWPYADSTITRYFVDQSDPANPFILYGDVYPEVLVTDNNEFDYYNHSESCVGQDSGFGVLTLEVLDKIDLDLIATGRTFADYDQSGPGGVPDGEIDYIFVVLRGNPRARNMRENNPNWCGFPTLNLPTYSGVSDLESRSGSISNTNWPGSRPTVTLDGVVLNWHNGSYIISQTSGNVLPQVYHPRLWAHEIGHDIWKNFFNTHLRAVVSNDVPYGPPKDTWVNGKKQETVPTRRVAYALMPGSGGADDMAGNETISAFERDLLDWIDCPELLGDQANVVLNDLYTTGDCRRVTLPNSLVGDALYLSNVQHVSFFDSLFFFQEEPPSTYTAEEGLKATGLLVSMVDGLLYDELPADNTLVITNWSTDYTGDLYSDTDGKVQITPWTRPNINGRSSYVTSDPIDWKAIVDIHYTGSPDGQLAFDFIDDFRTAPVITEDSWIGSESESSTFAVDIVVEAGATLTIEEGTVLDLAANLTIKSGATLIVEEDVTIQLAASKSIKGYGLVKLLGTSSNPIMLERSGTGNWTYVYLYGSGANGSQIKHVIMDHSQWGLYAKNVANLYVEDLDSRYNQNSGLVAYSLTGSEVHDSFLRENGMGALVVAGGLKAFDSKLADNNYGVYVISASAAFGEEGLGGYNAIYDNSQDGVFASASSVNLGEAVDIVNPDGYAGYNDICGNSGHDVDAWSSSDVMAEENYWGEVPPATSDFNIGGGSTFDYQPYHADDNTGLCTQNKTTAFPGITVHDSEDVRDGLLSSTGAFVRWAQEIRDADGRAAAVSAMEKVAADEENPHRVVAQMFRLYDLIHLGRVDEAIRVGEGELARTSASDADKAQIARPLFDAYTHERSDAANAGRMKALIEQTSTDDAPLQLLDAEMLAEVPRVEQGIESAAIQLADEPLVEVYPNPFNPAVTIAYRLTEESVVRLDVYDVLGRRVERLVDATQPAGRYEVVFSRSHLPTGVYLYHLEVGGQVRSGSVILVK